MTLQVKADETIFKHYQLVSQMVKNLGSIVQNDTELTMEEWFDWLARFNVVQRALSQVWADTQDHVLQDKK